MNPAGLLRLADAVWLTTCDSTQAVGRRLAAEGAPEGTLILADAQTGGHGREGRVWHSPGGGLYTSFLLRPRIDAARWIAFTPLVALALAEALEALRAGAPVGRDDAAGEGLESAANLRIKWPNDLYGGEGKLAGVIAETEGAAVVVGLGLNLHQRRGDFPTELRARASSLRMEGFDLVPTRSAVLDALNGTLSRAYASWQDGHTAFLAEGLRRRFLLAGRAIRLKLPGPSLLEGVARDVGECGELILETAEGRRVIVSGEVDWIGPAAVQ
jgi:BirA family transcriptional regulator, biotin operon repressor / biotin---[acetyl-CoA-carboxylase] ligase